MIRFFNFIKKNSKILEYLVLGIFSYIILYTDLFNVPNEEVTENLYLCYRIVVVTSYISMLLIVHCLGLICSFFKYIVGFNEKIWNKLDDFLLSLPWPISFALFLVILSILVVILITSLIIVRKDYKTDKYYDILEKAQLLNKRIKYFNHLDLLFQARLILNKNHSTAFESDYLKEDISKEDFLFFDKSGNIRTNKSIWKDCLYYILLILGVAVFIILLGLIVTIIAVEFFGDTGVYWLEVHLRGFIMDLFNFTEAIFDLFFSLSNPIILFVLFVNGTIIFWPILLPCTFLILFEPEMFIYLFNLLDPELQYFFANYIKYFSIIYKIWTTYMSVFIVWAFSWIVLMQSLAKRYSLPNTAISLQIVIWEIIFFFFFIG